MLTIPEFADLSVTRQIQCPDTDIIYNIRERKDVLVTGVDNLAYMFYFRQMGPVREGEFSEFILAHEDVDAAIEYFGAKYLKLNAYHKATFSVECIGIDFNPYRNNPMVMTK